MVILGLSFTQTGALLYFYYDFTINTRSLNLPDTRDYASFSIHVLYLDAFALVKYWLFNGLVIYANLY